MDLLGVKDNKPRRVSHIQIEVQTRIVDERIVKSRERMEMNESYSRVPITTKLSNLGAMSERHLHRLFQTGIIPLLTATTIYQDDLALYHIETVLQYPISTLHWSKLYSTSTNPTQKMRGFQPGAEQRHRKWNSPTYTRTRPNNPISLFLDVAPSKKTRVTVFPTFYDLSAHLTQCSCGGCNDQPHSARCACHLLQQTRFSS